MLSEHEQRTLRAIEAELTGAARARRARLLAAGRIVVLVLAVALTAGCVVASALHTVGPAPGALLCASCGALLGWQALSHARRHALGPRARSCLRRMRHRHCG